MGNKRRRGRTARQAQVQAGSDHNVSRSRRVHERASVRGLTLDRYLEEWLQSKEPVLAQTTAAWYRWVVGKYITPEIGHIAVQELEPLRVQRLYADRLRQRPGGEQPISRASVRCIHRILHAALSQAVRLQIIARNPCDMVDPPKGGKPRPRYWRPEEAVKFLDAVRTDRLFALFHLALGSGLRRGELLGLRWSDLDLTRQSLTVNQVRVRAGNSAITKDPKTSGSRRTIALSAQVCESLRNHLQAQLEEKRLMAEKYHDQDLVFASTDGSPLNPDYIGCQYFRRLISIAHVPVINFHGLRHTHATLLAMGGIPLKTVSARLGHSSVKMTGDIYSHVLDRMDQEAANQFDAVMSRALPEVSRSQSTE